MKEMDLSGPKWTSTGWPRPGCSVEGVTPGTMNEIKLPFEKTNNEGDYSGFHVT